jgi:triosephosphate isomerase
MKNLIIGNWKMNPQSYLEAEDLVKNIINGIEDTKDVSIVVCPPFTWVTDFSHKNKSFVSFGAQNVFYEDKGAYTGEISAQMLKNSNVEYVIIGHSERRKYFGETNEIINKKVKKALEVGLKVIFCIGETEEERNAGKKNEILETQIKEGLFGIDNLEDISVAYEPVWAIGTGNNCSVEETKETVEYIRKFVKPETKILYGGSVKSDNSGAYIKEAGANGLLVGGASLNAEEFVKIVKSAE